MKKQQRKYLLIAVLAAVLLTAVSAQLITARNSANKAKAKAEAELLKEQEAKKAEEQKKLEEEKKLAEKKKQEDDAKIQLAVEGKGVSKKIPVLMYHSIDFEKGNPLRIPKDKFRLQMKYLKDSGFTPLTLNELYSYLVFGSQLPAKPIVLTLDDGYVDNYTNAFPVLKEFNFKATVFMITSLIDTNPKYLTSSELVEMDKAGVDIESHSVTHPELNTLSYDNQLQELKTSKAALEKILGREVPYLAYPFGKFNNDTLKITQDLGYKMAFSTIIGVAGKSDGIYKLHRFYVSNDYSMDYFKQMVNSGSK